MNTQLKLVLVALGLGATILGASLLMAKSQPAMAAEGGVKAAIAVLAPTEGSTVKGTFTFKQVEGGVEIEGHVTGLKASSKHGFHIHEFGDQSSPDGNAAGGHFNPTGHDHGAPDAEKRHIGDLGNIESDAQGHAHYKRLDKTIELNGENCILGRGLVVHAGTDDLKTQPTGDAGARAAVGVIGVAKSE